MAMKKSISRTLAQIDVAANISVRIHEDFFNTHPCSRHLSESQCSVAAWCCEIRFTPTISLEIGGESPHFSFVAQRHYRVDARGMASGEVAGGERNKREERGDSDESQRVVGFDVDQDC